MSITDNEDITEGTEVNDDTLTEDLTEDGNTAESGAKDDNTDTDEVGDGDLGATDYAALAAADMKELCAIFPELSTKRSITELDNPLRYAALRDLGLTPKEAYLATCERGVRYDNRSHLTSAVPRAAAKSGDELFGSALDECRELFFGLSDKEIQKLYKKVTR